MTNTHPRRDPYDVLQVQRTASAEVIRAAYRALAWKFHPDTGAQPKAMVAINDAWHILGNPARRAAYDAAYNAARTAPTPTVDVRPTPRATDVDAGPATENGLAPRPRATDGTGSALDFGRYEGWTIGRLVAHDPDYLRWLARTPVGRRLAPEMDVALSGRDRDAERLVPRPAPARRSLFGGLTARARP